MKKKNNINFTLLLLVFIALMAMFSLGNANKVSELNYNQLIQTLETKNVKDIKVKTDRGVLVVQGNIKLTDDPKARLKEQKFVGKAPHTNEQYNEIIKVAKDKNIKLGFDGQESNFAA
ncbi:MAG: ATP-dependent metallopeptidase FtsH/Yme1/Tma family protein, partial [Erysipelotrichales bacterium]